MTRRFRQALRAGTVAYAVSLLAIALFVSPIVGSHLDFGHTHAQNTAAHVHAISDFFTSSTPQSVNLFVLSSSIIVCIGVVGSSVKSLALVSTRQSRAPPIFL